VRLSSLVSGIVFIGEWDRHHCGVGSSSLVSEGSSSLMCVGSSSLVSMGSSSLVSGIVLTGEWIAITVE
jgi:hypothetical protein